MGSDPAAAYPPDADETPRRIVRLAPFRLARTPVTNAQYREFARATGRSWAALDAPDDVPVTYVNLEDTLAFCAWAEVRLPAEHEWEAAARGGDDRLWPWGEELPSPSRAVFARPIGAPEPVGSCPAGASAHGALDLAGNVTERVSDAPVVRGGSFLDGPDELRSSHRLPMHPAARDTYVGFRPAAAEGSGRLRFDWVEIAGGEHPIGRDPVTYGGPVRDDELPEHVVEVHAFELARTPVTIGQYALFVSATGAAPPPDWPDGSPPPGRAGHPVVFVDWFDAASFCSWAGGRLPTEAEWEKAARSADGRRFPWGAEDDLSRAAIGSGLKYGDTEPVGRRTAGASPYGLLDLAGNVWEWVSSGYRPYPYDAGDGREDPDAPTERVLRGGSFASPGSDHGRSAMRSRSRPERRQRHIGFRVAREARS
jgi:formylglycine-generating enzyme required for sulfatase activity